MYSSRLINIQYNCILKMVSRNFPRKIAICHGQKSEKIVTARNVELAIRSLALGLHGALEGTYDSGLVM